MNKKTKKLPVSLSLGARLAAKRGSAAKKVLIGVVIAFFALVAITNAGGLSLKDKIAQVAGDALANKLYQAMAPNVIEEEQALGAASVDIQNPWVSHNGVVTYIMGGDLPTATTNVLSIRNPFGSSASTTADSAYERGEITWQVAIGDIGKNATSTVDLAIIRIDTAATSSFRLRCGVAATAYDPPTDLSDIINFQVPTSTTQTLVSGNATSTAGEASISGVPVKVSLTQQYSFFVCRVSPPDGIGASVWENGIGFNRDGAADVAAGVISTDNPVRWRAKVRIIDVP